MSKKRGYSGAYRDSKDRVRPITPPKKRSKAKTGAPIRTKKKKASKKPKVRTSKGTSYWPSFPEARAYALKHDLPTDRIIEYEKGWAIQKEVSGAYYDHKKGRWNSGMSAEFEEFKHYIAISPSTKELHMTEKEIVDHPRLSPGEKNLLYQYIRARDGFLFNERLSEYQALKDVDKLAPIRKAEEDYKDDPEGLSGFYLGVLGATNDPEIRAYVTPLYQKGLDPVSRNFKSAGAALEHGWTKTADDPADAKDANANATAKEWFGVMTLTAPSLEVPGKYVVYYRDHPESTPPQAEFDLARKNNQNVMMWNNDQWEWSYSQGTWLKQRDMTVGEDIGRLKEPGVMVVSPRLRGLGSDPDRGTRGKIIYTDPTVSISRSDLESAYVNSWRRRFNSNAGLSTKKMKGMTDRELRWAIRGNNDMAEMAGR